MKNRKLLSYCVTAGLLTTVSFPGCAAPTQAETSTLTSGPMFPFVLPWDDASKTFVDVSSINPAPITEQQRIKAKDGHFYDETGRRVRFLGVNFSFDANFPDKTTADKIAARMHKLGINCVRLHHMDTRRTPLGLISAKSKYPDTQHLDSVQLDKLDYLVAALKKNGIYVDLNLHVGRTFNEADGLPKLSEGETQPHYAKKMLWYEQRFIELQKQYAKDLLTHVNPYTGLSYADDPVTALVEIVNEDTLTGTARDVAYFKRMYPRVYVDDFVNGWNSFLLKKYKNSRNLLQAWNKDTTSLGNNFLLNSQFTNGTTNWKLELQGKTKAKMAVVPDDNASSALQVHIEKAADGTGYLLIRQGGLHLEENNSYTLSFRAKASSPRSVRASFKLDKAPWTAISPSQAAAVDSDWKRYSFIFQASHTEPDHGRLDIRLSNQEGDVWLSDISLRPGFEFDLSPGESLEQGNLPLPQNDTGQARRDYIEYLIGIEEKYSEEMRRYIKTDIQCKAPLIVSQASFLGVAGLWRERNSDVIDMHNYWQHPKFTGGRAWDRKNWIIPNTPMVLSQNRGTFPILAMYHMSGKPLTVSEYNHPAPNSYRAETLPLLASFAAWQDWDGIMLFDYNSKSTFTGNSFNTFFDIDHDSAQTAFLPAAARIFLSNSNISAVAPSKELTIPQEDIVDLVKDYAVEYTNLGNSVQTIWNKLGISNADAVSHPLKVQFGSVPKMKLTTLPPSPNAKINLCWDVDSAAETGLYNASAPQWNAVVNYNPNSTVIKSGDLTITPLNKERPFGAYTLTSMDNKPVNTSGKLLLTAGGFVENQDMGWNADRTSVGDQWGHGPVMAEGLEATISLKTIAQHAMVYALDGTGKETTEVPCKLNNGELSFTIEPKYKAMWYEIKTEGNQ